MSNASLWHHALLYNLKSGSPIGLVFTFRASGTNTGQCRLAFPVAEGREAGGVYTLGNQVIYCTLSAALGKVFVV